MYIAALEREKMPHCFQSDDAKQTSAPYIFLPDFSKLMQSFSLEDSCNLKALCIEISCGDFSFQKLIIKTKPMVSNPW